MPGVDCTLASVRYELSKLRAKKLVEKLEHTRRYQLTAAGCRLSVVYLKLFERVYAPLISGLSQAGPRGCYCRRREDPQWRRSTGGRLMDNENKIPVSTSITSLKHAHQRRTRRAMLAWFFQLP